MNKLSRDGLYSLEKYAQLREAFRERVMAHKKHRVVAVGPNVNLYFEDRLTMHYQVQEMLHVERIFEAEGIQDELDAYNPLIPDGRNWKATFMIQYEEPSERQKQLARLIGIEDRVWVQVDGFERVWAIADEDLERDTQEKTSSVHFLRFELSAEMAAAVKKGVAIAVGIDHERYRYSVESLPEPIRESLATDLD